MKKGWPTKRLGEVCQFRGGGTPSKAVERYWLGDIPWVSPKDMKFDVVSDSIDHISQEAIDGSATSLIPKDSVLMVVRSGILARIVPIAITGRELTINQDLKALCPNGAMDARFLYHLLDSKMELLLSMVSRGATVHRLMTDQIRDIDFVLPPLAEQQRIVGLLDDAFEGLATAKANAEKNLQNARALFESHLQSVFTQRGPGWVEKSLGETCEMYQPKTIGTKDLVPDGPYPVFGANGVIGRYDKFNHDEPQLLVTCRGATCGSVNISEPKSWITGNAMVVRPKDHALDLHFLEFVFRGGIDISAAITGAAQPQITRTNLSPLLIRYPKSVTEQTRLAEKFEDLTEETQRLARLYERKHAALEALKKSLLHQAFTGLL